MDPQGLEHSTIQITIIVGNSIECEGAISTVGNAMNMSRVHLQIYTRTSKKQHRSKVNQCPYACMFSHKLCVYIYIYINVCIHIHMPFVLGSVFCCIQATITPPTHNTQHRMPFMHKLCSSYIFGSFYHDLWDIVKLDESHCLTRINLINTQQLCLMQSPSPMPHKIQSTCTACQLGTCHIVHHGCKIK